MTLKQIQKWAASKGVHVERVNSRRIDVFTDGGIVAECANIAETVEAVNEFIFHTTTARSKEYRNVMD